MNFINFNTYKISKLSLGTVQLGLDYGISNSQGKVSKKESKDILNFVTENGINCFDTASAYGDSEKVLGTNLSGNNYIISKLSSDEFLTKSSQIVKTSLKNLQTQTLFGLLLHDGKLLSRWSNTCTEIIKKLENENSVKYFGVSIYTNEEFNLALKNPCISIIQIPFNLFDQRAIQNQWLLKAKKANKLLFIRSIFLQGLFFMDSESVKQQLPQAQKEIIKLQRICNKHKLTINTLALNFVNTLAKDSIILFGCDNIKQAQNNIDIYNSLSELDDNIINDIIKEFNNIDDTIYNPTKW